MNAPESILDRLCELVQDFLERYPDEFRGIALRPPRGTAVIAGRNDESDASSRVGVLVEEDDICLVILSKRLAVGYGVVTPPEPPTPPDPSEDVPAPGPKPLYYIGGGFIEGEDPGPGLCVWDPATGRIRCTG